MEHELDNVADSPPQEPKSYREICEEQCPLYLSMGMSYELYWDGEPCAVKHFRAAFEVEKARENERMWTQGLYIYDTLLRVAPVLHAFGGNAKPKAYIEKPYDFKAKTEEAQLDAVKESFKRQMEAINAKFQGGEIVSE